MMEEEFKKILESLQKLKLEKGALKVLLSDNKKIKTWIKIDPFDYNLALYFNLVLVLEDESGNSVETSIDQIQLEDKVLENDLREKYIHTKEELLVELSAFRNHSVE